MDDKERRDAFNMKVLKRQDPNIVDIVGSAAFVVLYEHDGEWTKLGIEGPMFLYRRSVLPTYGFFVLNRNGVENFSAHLTTADDLELTDEFIIYRADSEDQVLGIWVYDAKERQSIGQMMAKLHASSSTETSTQNVLGQPPPPHASSSSHSSSSSAWQTNSSSPLRPQAGQSISLDALFSSSPSTHHATASSPTPKAAPSGTALLDSIFKSAVSAPRPPSASPLPSTQAPNGLADQNADGLKALLGLPANKQPEPVANPVPPSTLPQDLEALFASARVSSQPPPQNHTATSTTTLQAPLSNANGSKFANAASSALDSSLAERHGLASALDRRDFVREVLSLIHTDKAFVDDLYQRYLSRVQ